MITETYSFTATARKRNSEETFTFICHLFPGGEVMVLNEDRPAEWYENLDSLAAWDAEVIASEPTGAIVAFTTEELVGYLRQSVEECRVLGVDPREYIPTSLHSLCEWFELEAHDGGCWSISNTSPLPDATQFDTLAEAKAEIDYWEGEGRDITTLRVVRVTLTDREVVYQPPVEDEAEDDENE